MNMHDELAQFAAAIVRGDAPPARWRTAPHYALATGLEVYRNNYRGNLQDALAGAYPVIGQLVGDEFFRMLARRFIEHQPSRSANLFDYGAELGDFLAGFAPAQSLPYLPDMARLEWACHAAYFAADAATLDLERLAQVAPADYAGLRLQLQPACRIVSSNYPVVAIWQAHQPGSAAQFHIDLDSGAEIALISRREDVVNVTALATDAADWSAALLQGATLGAATAATLARFPGFDLQTTLIKLAALDVLSDFTLEATT